MKITCLLAAVSLAFASMAPAQRMAADPNSGSSFGAGSGMALTNYAADLNMHWARMPANVTPADIGNMQNIYQMLDNTVLKYQANGIVPLGIISPQATGTGVWVTASQFAQAVSNIAERYDGDGLQDMPGLLYSVGTWELLNEYSSAGGGAYSGLSRDVFISMMTNGAAALKAAYPEARLALDPFDTNDVIALFQKWSPANVDVISYHTYSPLDAPLDANSISYLPNIAGILAALGLQNVPVWATEYAFYDHQGAVPPKVAATQADNARWFVQTTVWGLGSGLLKKIIYTEVEAPRDSEERLDWMSLVDTNGVKRQIYYAYKKLASLIDNYSLVEPVTAGANVYAYRFTCGTSSVAVAWCKEGTATQENVSISGCSGTHAALLTSVPDTGGSFAVTTAEVVGAAVVIPSLGSTPIIITETAAPPEPPAVDASAPLAADFDGDAKADPAIFNTNGTWKIKLSSGGYSLLTLAGFLGGSGYTSLAADFDGDAKADPAIYNAELELWAVKLSSIGYLAPTILQNFGGASWQALAGDFDGDRLADPALYNTNGTWQVKLSTAGYATVTSAGLLGFAGWTAVAADMDGDGKADPTIYQASTGSWIVILSRSAYALALLDPGFLGGADYVGMAVDFDGDRIADPAVAQTGTGNWKVKLSSGSYSLVELNAFLGD